MKRGRKRRAAETLRIYGPPERRAFVKALPCIVCGSRPCENAHTANGGLSRKADAETIVPLCPAHHRELHRIGIRSFEAKYDVDLAWIAARIEELWQAHLLMTAKDEPLCVTCGASFREVGEQCASCAYQPPRDAA